MIKMKVKKLESIMMKLRKVKMGLESLIKDILDCSSFYRIVIILIPVMGLNLEIQNTVVEFL